MAGIDFPVDVPREARAAPAAMRGHSFRQRVEPRVRALHRTILGTIPFDSLAARTLSDVRIELLAIHIREPDIEGATLPHLLLGLLHR
jgi:hypothetical protein